MGDGCRNSDDNDYSLSSPKKSFILTLNSIKITAPRNEAVSNRMLNAVQIQYNILKISSILPPIYLTGVVNSFLIVTRTMLIIGV